MYGEQKGEKELKKWPKFLHDKNENVLGKQNNSEKIRFNVFRAELESFCRK